ncbi:GTPase-activating Rap/Ran-GAP domain-like protein 3, partial [Balamuthia mandrillaris]
NDPRLNSVVKQYDPRCHFGLVCGTASCPPIQVYLPDTVDAQLEDNTKRFCMLTTSIFPDVKQIVIARVFGWFRDDFGETDQEVLKWLAPYLESPLDQELTAAIENEQYEVRCGQWNFETNNWTRPLDSSLEATGKDLDSELIRPSEGFRRELGTERRIGYEGFLNEASQNHDLNVYQAYFANNPHTNYLGKHPTEGVICVSVVSEKEQLPPPGSPAARKKSLTKAGGKKYRCLIRTKRGDSHAILAAPSQKELFDSLRSVYAFLDKKLLTQIDNPQFAKDLLSFEDDMMYTEFKFGVLYYRQGQVLEDDMFANVETSKEYEEFLELLGNKVELKGWNQYSAGLDTQRNQTGTHSLYTQWNDYEIMFHVATLLPYSKRDTQQIERKRHLGNDVVLIIFTDGTTPFNPQCINSKYNQIHVVVQAVKEGDEVLYRVAVASREDVPAYAPSLPNPAIFPKGPKLREFLLKKMINGLKASFKSPSFAKKIERSRHLALEEYAKKYL